MAIITKIIGCGLGAKLCKYKNREAAQIGVGMVSRGEVALIVAAKGEAVGLMGTAFMGPVIIVVIITTIIAPILLKLAFRDRKKKNGGDGSPPEVDETIPQTALVQDYERAKGAVAPWDGFPLGD